MKTSKDDAHALSVSNVAHFCGIQSRRTFPLHSEHQVMPTALIGTEVPCCKHPEPTHSPTAALEMRDHAQVQQKTIRLILE